MGSGIARMVLAKPGLELVGAFSKRAHRGGMDLGEVIGLDRSLGIPINTDLEKVIEETRPEVAIQATYSRATDAAVDISLPAVRRDRAAMASVIRPGQASDPAGVANAHECGFDNGTVCGQCPLPDMAPHPAEEGVRRIRLRPGAMRRACWACCLWRIDVQAATGS